MRVFTFTPVKYFGSNTYILSSESEAVVIDPSVPFSEAEQLISSEALNVKYIILTHTHFDHMLTIDDWVLNTDAEVIVGEDDAYGLMDSYINCYRLFVNEDKGYFGKYRAVSENDKLFLGTESINIIKTPGHTKGSISIVADDKIFVGDVVFAEGGIGRTDLPGGDYQILAKSIEKIAAFPPQTIVYSGHGDLYTVNKLKRKFI